MHHLREDWMGLLGNHGVAHIDDGVGECQRDEGEQQER